MAISLTLFAPAQSVLGAAPQSWAGNPKDGAAELERMWTLFESIRDAQPAGQKQRMPIRGVLRFAVEAAGLPPSGWRPDLVEEILAFARSQQDTDPSSGTYGNFRWASNQGAVHDPNAGEFVSQMMGLLYKQYGDRLSPGAKARLLEMMDTVVASLDSHQIKIEYTNIWLMKAWAYISLGEALGRPGVAAKGYAIFDEWLAWTARNGIGEFGAVTYYGIDLDSLGMIAKLADRPEAREKAMKAVRYLWTDAAANWWANGDRLGGANSRSYDYLFGTGYFELYTWPAGWLRKRPAVEGTSWLPGGKRRHLTAMIDTAHVAPPPEWTEAIRAEIPRMVVQRWGEKTGMTAANWIGRSVNIASSGCGRGNDDRVFSANLGDSPDVPQLTFFMDGRGDPFGTKKTANKASQPKALHIVPFVATVQRGPEVLQLLSSDPRAAGPHHEKGDLSCLLTHLIIPAQAEIWVDDRKVEPGSRNKPLILKKHSLICARLGDGVVAMRVLHADVTKGETWKRPEIRLIKEDYKRGAPVCRYTIVHDRNEPRGRASTVAWFRAADIKSDGEFAAFRKAFAAASGSASRTGDIMQAEVAGMAGAMRIEADIGKGERRVLDGGEPVPGALNVNGRDLAAEILGEFLKQ